MHWVNSTSSTSGWLSSTRGWLSSTGDWVSSASSTGGWISSTGDWVSSSGWVSSAKGCGSGFEAELVVVVLSPLLGVGVKALLPERIRYRLPSDWSWLVKRVIVDALALFMRPYGVSKTIFVVVLLPFPEILT